MKKKIIYILITLALIASAFLLGRNTAPTHTVMPASVDLSDDTQFNYIDSFLSSIVDWNTDGQELSIMTSNGYELYTYKQSDEYSQDRKAYIPLNSIESWNIDGNTLEIIRSDGNAYTFNK